MILFSGNLGLAVTGAGIQLVATVPLSAGLLLDGVLRGNLSARRTTGAGTSSQRVRVGGVDLIVPGGDTSTTVFNRGYASALNPNNLRGSAMSSRGPTQFTGLANVNLADPLNLTFDLDLGTDTDVFTFDELTVEYLPSP